MLETLRLMRLAIRPLIRLKTAMFLRVVISLLLYIWGWQENLLCLSFYLKRFNKLSRSAVKERVTTADKNENVLAQDLHLVLFSFNLNRYSNKPKTRQSSQSRRKVEESLSTFVFNIKFIFAFERENKYNCKKKNCGEQELILGAFGIIKRSKASTKSTQETITAL